jgi:hypothetical protein
MTKSEREVMKRYTRTRYTTLFLSIDNQEFVISGTDRENIKWFQKRLAEALTRMIEAELTILLEPVVAKEEVCR